MGTISDSLKDDPSEAERFGSYAVKENPNIENFEDFETAFYKAFNSGQGQHFIDFLDMEEKTLIFDSKIVQKTIKENLKIKGIEEIEAPLYEVQRKPVRKARIKDVYEGKPFMQVKSYQKDHRTIRGYAKTYNRWSPAQTKFLVSRKQNKIPVKEVVTKYNVHFKENPRPEKSIKSKFYRVK